MGIARAVSARVPAVLIVLAGLFLQPARLLAQGDRAVPKREYFMALSMLDEGQFASALEAFNGAARSGVRSTEGRWVDSICYYAMIGECYYQLGDSRQQAAQ